MCADIFYYFVLLFLAMEQNVLKKILDSKIIAIVRGVSSGDIVNLTNALLMGGVCCIEVTFDQTSKEKENDTLSSIKTIVQTFGDEVCVGAGTVMTLEQVNLAVQAGAQYIISPNVDETIIRETKRLGKVSIPGAMTPSEVSFAYNCGADIVKLFPAGVLGVEYFKAVKAPLKHIPLAAVAGITLDNCEKFLKAGAVAIGCASNIIDPKLVAQKNYEEITAKAQAYSEIIKHFT